MPFPAAVLVGLAVLAAAVDWVAVWFDGPRWRALERVAKPAVIVLLLGASAAWPMADGADPVVRACLVLALAASLAGDVLLLPPGRLLPGLVAFLVGHVAYTTAFIVVGGEPAWLLAGLVIAGLVVGAVGPRLVTAARSRGFGLPVVVYLWVISVMAIAATRTGDPLAIVGAWLFVASDAMLGFGQFVVPRAPDGRAPRALRMGVITTYHVGQVLLTVSLLAA